MKTTQMIAAAVLSLSGAAAFAADAQFGSEPYVSFPVSNSFSHAASGSKTKAEVQVELVQARAEGQSVGGEAYVATVGKTTGSSLSRTEVKAEAIKAAANDNRKNMRYNAGG